MKELSADLVVIGAGAAGLSVAAGAAQLGVKVILIESGAMGGDCLNYGCVPSKALISAANSAYHTKGDAEMGIIGSAAKVDWQAVRAHIQSSIQAIAPHDSVERFEGLGVHVLQEHARFLSPNEVAAGNYKIKARRFVIATGARAATPLINGLSEVSYLTNETVFDLPELPAHLIILGGGVIGVEMAQAFARLGAKVSLVEAAQLVQPFGAEATSALRRALISDGVDIYENISVNEVTRADAGVVLHLKDGTEITGSHLLVATGRKANIAGLGLDAAGVQITAQGHIKTDHRLRSTNKRIFALGDVAAGPNLTHFAGYQAGLVVQAVALGLKPKYRTDHVPQVIYTDPQIAQIGLTEHQAREKFGEKLQIIRQEFAKNDRAICEGALTGHLTILIYRGRAVGVQIIGPDAGDLISPWAIMLSAKLPLSKIARSVFAYPTRSEVHKAAVGAYFAPKLFNNRWLRRFVRFVQTVLP